MNEEEEEDEEEVNEEEEEEEMRRSFFVAVHVGAGYHSPKNASAYRKAMHDACLAAASVLSQVSMLSLSLSLSLSKVSCISYIRVWTCIYISEGFLKKKIRDVSQNAHVSQIPRPHEFKTRAVHESLW